jgi:hypothetical protein
VPKPHSSHLQMPVLLQEVKIRTGGLQSEYLWRLMSDTQVVSIHSFPKCKIYTMKTRYCFLLLCNINFNFKGGHKLLGSGNKAIWKAGGQGPHINFWALVPNTLSWYHILLTFFLFKEVLFDLHVGFVVTRFFKKSGHLIICKH